MTDDNADRTRVSSRSGKDDRTRIAGSGDAAETPEPDAPDVDSTRVAATPDGRVEGADAPGSVTGTGSTTSSWSHPERWSSRGDDQPVGPGSVLKQRFVLEELIGQGGMGAVYKARDLRKQEAEDSQPFVALKLLSDEFRQHPDALVALQREAKKSQVLAHPNIVTVYDFDRDGQHVFMTMELLQGDPLDVVIRRRGALGGLPYKEAFHIIDRMARGLAYAHQEGFVHSDFKPGNVFLNKDGNAKILDFGIARAAARLGGTGTDAGEDDTRFDPASLGAITPAYASAEMLEGETPEAADDVYALCCVAHELLTGKHPFLDEAGNKLPADEAARRGLRPAPVRGVPRRVNHAIARGLKFRREERFPDANTFLDAVKGRARLRRTLLATAVVMAVLASVSWWITIRESDVLVTINDLSPHLEESRSLLREGNRYMEDGEVEQAYKAYTQAWESGESLSATTSRDRTQLRILVDRRINDVIEHYVQRSKQTDLDEFEAELLRLTLETLKEQNPDIRADDIDAALERLSSS